MSRNTSQHSPNFATRHATIYDDLAWGAKSCPNADQFIFLIQRSDERAEKLGLGRKASLLGKLYDWSYSTPELTQRFKFAGWFGIASDYWQDCASNPTRQDSDAAETFNEKEEHENDLRQESRQDYATWETDTQQGE